MGHALCLTHYLPLNLLVFIIFAHNHVHMYYYSHQGHGTFLKESTMAARTLLSTTPFSSTSEVAFKYYRLENLRYRI